MKVGLIKGSFNDSPTGTARVIFLPGCNAACKYCYNASLVKGDSPKNGYEIFKKDGSKSIEKELENNMRLNKNRAYLNDEWLVFSGGEPTLRPSLMLDILELELKVRTEKSGKQLNLEKECFNNWKPKLGIFTNALDINKAQSVSSSIFFDWISIDCKVDFYNNWCTYKNTVDIWLNNILSVQFQTVIYRDGLKSLKEEVFPFIVSTAKQHAANRIRWNINQLSNMNGEIQLMDEKFNADCSNQILIEKSEEIEEIKQLIKECMIPSNLDIYVYGEKT